MLWKDSARTAGDTPYATASRWKGALWHRFQGAGLLSTSTWLFMVLLAAEICSVRSVCFELEEAAAGTVSGETAASSFFYIRSSKMICVLEYQAKAGIKYLEYKWIPS